MLPGASGSRAIPRKIAGRLMMTIEESRDAIKTPSVVLESAVHLYVSREPIADDPVCDGRLEPISVCVGREQDNPRATHESSKFLRHTYARTGSRFTAS